MSQELEPFHLTSNSKSLLLCDLQLSLMHNRPLIDTFDLFVHFTETFSPAVLKLGVRRALSESFQSPFTPQRFQ